MRTSRSIAVATCAGAIVAGVGSPKPALAQTPGYVLLGNPTATNGSQGLGVSPDGSAVCGYSNGSSGEVPSPGFVWTRSGGRYDFGLEPTSTEFTRAIGVSNGGTVAVGISGNLGLTRGFRWGGPGDFRVMGTGGRIASQATGVSGDGSVTIGYTFDPPNVGGQAFRWTQATGQQLLGYTRPSHVKSEALAISSDGSTIVGNSQDSGGFSDAFAWTEATGMRILPSLPSTNTSTAFGTNHDGSVVVGRSGGTAVLWRDNAIFALERPTGSSAFAVDVTTTGSVVLGTVYDNTSVTDGVWRNGDGWTPLRDYFSANGVTIPADWMFSGFKSMSDDGTVFVGSVGIPGAPYQAIVVTIPAPGVSCVMIVSSGFALRRRRVTTSGALE